MSTNTVIAYGICADNNDPWGVGRIRVIIDDGLTKSVTTGTKIDLYIQQLDARNTTEKGEAAYVPWELGRDNHAPDPYVFEPFLPKHLNIVPNIGESVKIIYYKLGDDSEQREYIAPHISNYDKLKYDTVQTARAFSNKTTFQPTVNNYRRDGIVADPTDVGVFGRNNSEMILPENEVILRAGHQDFTNRLKKDRHALVQVSRFPQRKQIITTIKNQNNTPSQQIHYIAEFTTTVDLANKPTNPLYITTRLNIYPVHNVDTKNYTDEPISPKYVEANTIPDFSVIISAGTVGDIKSFIKDFLYNLDRGNLIIDYSGSVNYKPANAEILKYNVFDERPPVNGVIQTDAYVLPLYMFRADPRNDYQIQEVQDLKNALTKELGIRPLSKRQSPKIEQVQTEDTRDDKSADETVVINGADKLFLLSWYNSQSIQSKIGKYGFPQDEIYLTLQKNTEPMVKGDMLIKLILDLFDLFENHGHIGGVDPIGSLNKDAVSKVTQIKERYRLTTPVSKDLSGGSAILNQYIRLD